MRQAVVLAGGLATRMLPRTRDVPKYLLPVAGRPFAAWHLERLAAHGLGDVVLAIGHLGDAIRAFVGDGSAFGVRARYVDEGDQKLGTGGALLLAAAEGALAETFLVTYGDSFLPFDYAAPLALLEARAELSAVMAVYQNRGALEASNVALSPAGDRVGRYEKGARDPALDHIDYGATALRRSALLARAADAARGFDRLQHALAREGALGALVATERFYEIGSPAGLADLEAHLVDLGR